MQVTTFVPTRCRINFQMQRGPEQCCSSFLLCTQLQTKNRMKRYFLITIITGQTFELHFEKVISGFIPVGIPANNPRFLEMACELSKEGFMEPGTDARPKWICSSQIKSVEIIFEETLIKVNNHGS